MTSQAHIDAPQRAAAQAMISAGAMFHARGWVPATGGNFSALLSPQQLLITASGTHKGELLEADFLRANRQGSPLERERKSSYETRLHTQIYDWAEQAAADIGSVLHTHSRANTVLSRRFESIALTGYELQKVLAGAPDPSSSVVIPVFENDQDITRLAARVHDHMLSCSAPLPGYLISGHGLYAWGRNVAEARYRVEALEFMLDCHLTELLLQ